MNYFCRMFLSVENICDLPVEKLPFSMFGLCLQEPMAMVTNLIISITALIIYLKFKPVQNDFQKHWKLFFLTFGISTFFAGFGHVFFNYTEVYGKFPTWILGTFAAYHAGKAMISLNVMKESLKRKLLFVLYFKAVTLLILALFLKSFVFIMVDAVATYLFFCMGLGIYYWRKGLKSFKYTVIAVMVLFPSIFIFTLKFNPHIWFNKDDLSHILMAATIIFFYFGVVKLNQFDLDKLVSLKDLNYVKKQSRKH
ncbi:MAG: hypothetical protein WED10_07275 [Brumimicrobium sp.]